MPDFTDDPGWRGSIARFWQRSYAADYLGIVLLAILNFVLQLYVEPFHRMFSLDDRAISYPHAAVEHVSSVANIVYAGVGPLVLLILWAVAWRPGLHQTHVTILGFLISLLTTSLVTDIIKNAVGRPRPDLLARCKPQLGTPAHELVTIDVCTETDHHLLHDGWRSFPSGHSSFAFAGFGYLALFLAGQLSVLRPRSDLTSCLICIAPLIGAGLIAISRLEDYRHDVFDVTAGSILGMTLAYFSYRRYYRGLRHSQRDVPYPNPATLAEARGKFRRIDEENSMPHASEFELEDTDDGISDATPPREGSRGPTEMRR